MQRGMIYLYLLKNWSCWSQHALSRHQSELKLSISGWANDNFPTTFQESILFIIYPKYSFLETRIVLLRYMYECRCN